MSSRFPLITKTGLGRGLDRLMTGTKTAGQTDTGSALPTPAIKVDVQVGAGLNTLLRGSRFPDDARRSMGIFTASAPWSVRNRPVLVASLAAADLFLVGQAALFVFNRAQPLRAAESLFVLACVGLGAWLACLAVLLQSRDRP